MGHLCSALCTLKPKKPKNLKKIQKNLGFFQPCNLELTTELLYRKFLICETTFGSYLCDLHRELLDAIWSYEKLQQQPAIYATFRTQPCRSICLLNVYFVHVIMFTVCIIQVFNYYDVM